MKLIEIKKSKKQNQEDLNNFTNNKTKENKMKAVKVITSVITVLFVSVLIGCSDNSLLPTNSPVSEYSQNTDRNQSTDGNVPRDFKNTFSFKIQPNEVITLDSRITDLIGIRSFDISNCTSERTDLFVSASNLDQIGSLGCSWSSNSSFMIETLFIENRSNKVKKIEVVLFGR